MLSSGTNRNCDHSCGWAELWEVLHHTQCWIPHEMEGIVHETDHLNYLHKRSYFQDERIELQNGGNALHLGSNDSLIWTPDLYIYNLKSINIRYLRIVLSLLLFKDNSFFRLFIRYKHISNELRKWKLQRSVEEDLTPEPQTKWFSSWPFVQPGGRNWSDCTSFCRIFIFLLLLALDVQTLCDFRWFAFQFLTTSRSTDTRAMWM